MRTQNRKKANRVGSLPRYGVIAENLDRFRINQGDADPSPGPRQERPATHDGSNGCCVPLHASPLRRAVGAGVRRMPSTATGYIYSVSLRQLRGRVGNDDAAPFMSSGTVNGTHVAARRFRRRYLADVTRRIKLGQGSLR